MLFHKFYFYFRLFVVSVVLVELFGFYQNKHITIVFITLAYGQRRTKTEKKKIKTTTKQKHTCTQWWWVYQKDQTIAIFQYEITQKQTKDKKVKFIK